MALGFDQLLAVTAVQLGIPVLGAMPFEDYNARWPKDSQGARVHRWLLRRIRYFYVCEPGYSPRKMQTRNEWMVDNSTRQIACWDGTPGGTANCLHYADGAFVAPDTFHNVFDDEARRLREEIA